MEQKNEIEVLVRKQLTEGSEVSSNSIKTLNNGAKESIKTIEAAA